MNYSRTSLASYIADNIESSDVSKHVAAYLIESGKTADLDSIMRDVQEIRASQHGVVELTARSAFALDADEKSRIEQVAKGQYPKASRVIIHEVRDQSVVGGASLSLAQANLDATIKTKLNRLRESIA